MQKSRLVELFSALNKSERRELGKYVNSPVFNQRQDVADLYEYLYQNFPFEEERLLNREEVYAHLFPAEKFSSAKMDHTMSFLFSVIKSYLIDREQREDEAHQQILLVRSLRRRNLARLCEREIKIAEKKIEKEPLRDAAFHLKQFHLHLDKHTFAKQKSRTAIDSFEDFSTELTHYFLSKKLWESCTLVTHDALAKTGIQQDGMFEAVLNYVEQNDFTQVPAVNVYYHCYMALTQPDAQAWFERLRELIRENHHRFPQAEVTDLYLVVINYCIRKFNQGQREFLKEALKLYREGLEIGAFLVNGSLSRFTYNNIVMAGLLLKEFEWVEDFLFRYRDYIEPKFREGTFNYNLAIFYYQKKDHDEVLTLLQQVDFDDVNHNLSARRMLLKIYFERDEFEALNSLIISFKNYIYRKKELGAVARNSYLNLLKFTKKLMALNQRDKKAVATLKSRIEKTEPLAEKNWLLEVLSSL